MGAGKVWGIMAASRVEPGVSAYLDILGFWEKII